MEVGDTRLFEISEQSQIGDTRRQIVVLALDAGVDEKCCDRLSLVCQEVGTNLVKHSKGGGKILAQAIKQESNFGIDLYAVDNGRGMDVAECLPDGFSSSGTLGNGLGAISRLADQFHIHSAAQIGSVIHTRLWNTPSAKNAKFAWGALSVPKTGELVCGDKWAFESSANDFYALVVDGLGHGIEASEASQLAVKRFRQNLDLPPAAMIKLLHNSLRGSRGAVGAVAKLDLASRTMSFCGLGNIEGIIFSGGDSKHLVSLNGTLGYEARKFNEYSFPWHSDSTLIMHTDGLSSKTLHNYTALSDKTPALAAGWLYKMFEKNIDDATILVIGQVAS